MIIGVLGTNSGINTDQMPSVFEVAKKIKTKQIHHLNKNLTDYQIHHMFLNDKDIKVIPYISQFQQQNIENWSIRELKHFNSEEEKNKDFYETCNMFLFITNSKTLPKDMGEYINNICNKTKKKAITVCKQGTVIIN